MVADQPTRRLSPRGRRVALLTVVMALTSLVLSLGVVQHLPAVAGAPPQLPWLVLVAMVVLSEVLVIHLEARGEAHSITFSEVPLVIGLLLASPLHLVMARFTGASLTLWLHRRQSFRKLSFNVAMMTLETILALIVHRVVLGGADAFLARGWLALCAATLSAQLFGILAVTAVISLYSGRPKTSITRRVCVAGVTSALVNTAIGLALANALWRESWSAVPLAGLALVAFWMYRSYFSLAQRYASLESVHDFTRVVGRSLDLPTVAQTVLSSARELLRARSAALLLLGSPTVGAVLVTDDDDSTTVTPVSRQLADRMLDTLLPDAGRTPRLLGGEDLAGMLSGPPAKDAMATPVFGEQGTVGVVVVADRLADVSTFDTDDLKLLETLVNHAGVSLENGRLFRQLQEEAARRTHQALHDALTGLPNRLLLTEHLASALRDAEARAHKVAVLLIDLESFKEVNETLGHRAGDELLRRICERLSSAVPAGSTLARFGGDEFALLLPVVEGEHAAIVVADRIAQSLETPFVEQDLALTVSAAMGLALWPEHGTDPATLLQRAEVALFNAKGSHSGVEAYTTEGDPFTPQRLALAGELREAIGRREIEVHYQPQIDLRTGIVLGAEALVRWPHSRRGLLSPNEFIPAAERTGVIRPLTNYVLRSALQKCQAWRDAGLDLSVAVNLSVRNLLDPHLPGDVLTLLVEYSLPPEVLTLELTESSIMTENRRSLGVLSQLHEMGVRLAIDDFGTGYSSLSHLRRLPISEIKVDQTFVRNITVDHHDAAIVRSTIELGHQLGLKVVAEGAESRDDLEHLLAFGCDAVQGHVISRARTGQSFDTWLVDQPVRALDPSPLWPPAAAVGDVVPAEDEAD